MEFKKPEFLENLGWSDYLKVAAGLLGLAGTVLLTKAGYKWKSEGSKAVEAVDVMAEEPKKETEAKEEE